MNALIQPVKPCNPPFCPHKTINSLWCCVMYDNIYTDLTTLDDERQSFLKPHFPPLSAFVDGRGLACPMPLLKTKLALRTMGTGTLYVIASDQNSQTDLSYFCQKNTLILESWQSDTTADAPLFHFLIHKHA